MVNQAETHVFQQQAARAYMVKYGSRHRFRNPFAEERKDFFQSDPHRNRRTIRQNCRADHAVLDVIAIPESTHIERMKEALMC